MTQEPIFLLPVMQPSKTPDVVVHAPIVTPPVTAMGVGSEPVRQEPPKPTAEHKREPQHPHTENV
jgi:hypothetical protein